MPFANIVASYKKNTAKPFTKQQTNQALKKKSFIKFQPYSQKTHFFVFYLLCF